MKKIHIVLLVLFLGIPFQKAESLQMASISWNTFASKSEVISEARLVKVESYTTEYTYTFQIIETFKGPELKTVEVTASTYYHGYALNPGNSCFIALKKEKGKWKFSTMGRSCWAVKYELKTDNYTIARVEIDDFLIRDFPKSLKKQYTIKTLLANGKYHTYKAEIYLLNDIRKFLRKSLK